jgi:hypothetical protein
MKLLLLVLKVIFLLVVTLTIVVLFGVVVLLGGGVELLPLGAVGNEVGVSVHSKHPLGDLLPSL